MLIIASYSHELLYIGSATVRVLIFQKCNREFLLFKTTKISMNFLNPLQLYSPTYILFSEDLSCMQRESLINQGFNLTSTFFYTTLPRVYSIFGRYKTEIAIKLFSVRSFGFVECGKKRARSKLIACIPRQIQVKPIRKLHLKTFVRIRKFRISFSCAI